ncbi:endogenous retrovirus group K member 11 Pol [Labeo rohita]|uniref:ribonuclease H n=2 Tax=Labeo rohita TaxID=84645 RepID=A0A498MHE3_LABRO|nr:endogenous retrovirus group K member 11 Pol [Labeo rohita]
MEDGMNPPVYWRKFEADCHRTNDLGDRKWANEFRSKFIRHGSERNVLGRKPHFRADDVYGRPRPVAISFGLAFFSVPVHPETQPILAFTFQNAQYTWTRLAQGYVDSPAVFSAAVQRTLAKMTDLPSTVCVLQYADDLIISSETREDCEKASIIVCNVLAQAGFKASKEKLQWVQPKVTYLGHIIMPGLRAISTDRVQMIRKMKSPQTVQQLQRFLGLVNYCRSWIPDCAIHDKYLRSLIDRKAPPKTPLNWTDEAEMHFAALKKAITTAPSLGLPSFEREFHLHVRETEGVAMGVLLQQHGSTYRPVAYLSKKLDNVAAGMPACLRAVSAAAIVVQMAEKIVLSHPMIVYTSHQFPRHGDYQDPLSRLCAIFQRGRDIDSYVEEFLGYSHMVLGDNDLLKDCFLSGLDSEISLNLPWDDPEWSLAELIDFVLLHCGSTFTEVPLVVTQPPGVTAKAEVSLVVPPVAAQPPEMWVRAADSPEVPLVAAQPLDQARIPSVLSTLTMEVPPVAAPPQEMSNWVVDSLEVPLVAARPLGPLVQVIEPLPCLVPDTKVFELRPGEPLSGQSPESRSGELLSGPSSESWLGEPLSGPVFESRPGEPLSSPDPELRPGVPWSSPVPELWPGVPPQNYVSKPRPEPSGQERPTSPEPSPGWPLPLAPSWGVSSSPVLPWRESLPADPQPASPRGVPNPPVPPRSIKEPRAAALEGDPVACFALEGVSSVCSTLEGVPITQATLEGVSATCSTLEGVPVT